MNASQSDAHLPDDSESATGRIGSKKSMQLIAPDDDFELDHNSSELNLKNISDEREAP